MLFSLLSKIFKKKHSRETTYDHEDVQEHIALGSNSIPLVEKQLSVGSYESLIIVGSVDVQISKSIKEAQLIIPRNLVDYQVEQFDEKSKTLTIGLTEHNQPIIAIPKLKLPYQKTLKAITVNGTGTLYAEEMTEKLHLYVMDAASIRLHQLDLQELILSVMGTSDIQCWGKCHKANVSCIGAARVMLHELKCTNIHITTSGSSEAWVYANERLEINASGASEVRHDGDGVVFKTQEGLAKVRPIKTLAWHKG